MLCTQWSALGKLERVPSCSFPVLRLIFVNSLQVLGLPVIRVAGVEADDVIGTLATRASDDGFLVAVASPDKARIPALDICRCQMGNP